MKKWQDVYWFALYTGRWPKFYLVRLSYLPCLLAFDFNSSSVEQGDVWKRAFNFFKFYLVRIFWQKLRLDQISPVIAWFSPEYQKEQTHGQACGAVPSCQCCPALETSPGTYCVRRTFKLRRCTDPSPFFFFFPIRWRVCTCGEFVRKGLFFSGTVLCF